MKVSGLSIVSRRNINRFVVVDICNAQSKQTMKEMRVTWMIVLPFRWWKNLQLSVWRIMECAEEYVVYLLRVQ